MPRPTVSEISAFLADLRANLDAGSSAHAELMARKADLLERIAADQPNNTEVAEVAARARARADRLTTTD